MFVVCIVLVDLWCFLFICVLCFGDWRSLLVVSVFVVWCLLLLASCVCSLFVLCCALFVICCPLSVV